MVVLVTATAAAAVAAASSTATSASLASLPASFLSTASVLFSSGFGTITGLCSVVIGTVLYIPVYVRHSRDSDLANYELMRRQRRCPLEVSSSAMDLRGVNVPPSSLASPKCHAKCTRSLDRVAVCSTLSPAPTECGGASISSTTASRSSSACSISRTSGVYTTFLIDDDDEDDLDTTFMLRQAFSGSESCLLRPKSCSHGLSSMSTTLSSSPFTAVDL